VPRFGRSERSTYRTGRSSRYEVSVQERSHCGCRTGRDDMYLLSEVDEYQYKKDTYVLDVEPISSGLAVIATDQSLAVFDPLQLSKGPKQGHLTPHGNITACKVFDAPGSTVATAGENGTVTLWDLRDGTTRSQVWTQKTGMSSCRRPGAESYNADDCTFRIWQCQYSFSSLRKSIKLDRRGNRIRRLQGFNHDLVGCAEVSPLSLRLLMLAQGYTGWRST